MSAQASIYGRLVADPKPIQTKTGTAMTTGTMAVSLPTKDGEDATWWVNLLAFGRQAELLAGLEIPSFLETQIIPSVRLYKRCCFR